MQMSREHSGNIILSVSSKNNLTEIYIFQGPESGTSLSVTIMSLAIEMRCFSGRKLASDWSRLTVIN